MYIIHGEFLQWINEKCNQIKVQPFLAGNLIQTHWPRHLQAIVLALFHFSLLQNKLLSVCRYPSRSFLLSIRLSFSSLYNNRQYIFSIILFNNLFFATSFYFYYFVNVDIPMRNLVMEQKCFGQMASFKWSIADT